MDKDTRFNRDAAAGDHRTEERPQSDGLIGDAFGATEASNTAAGIKIDGFDVDISEFPAIRMALGLDAADSVTNNPEPLNPEPEEPPQDVGGAAEMLPESYLEWKSELPALFTQQPDPPVVQLDEYQWGAEQDVFTTLDEEKEKQEQISTELIGYIDLLENDTETLLDRRREEKENPKKKKAADPYNSKFNSRYDDTDEVLEKTPEIPLEPRYELKRE